MRDVEQVEEVGETKEMIAAARGPFHGRIPRRIRLTGPSADSFGVTRFLALTVIKLSQRFIENEHSAEEPFPPVAPSVRLSSFGM